MTESQYTPPLPGRASTQCFCCHSTDLEREWAATSPFFAQRALCRHPQAIMLIKCLAAVARHFDFSPTKDELDRLYAGYRRSEYFVQRNSFEPWYTRVPLQRRDWKHSNQDAIATWLLQNLFWTPMSGVDSGFGVVHFRAFLLRMMVNVQVPASTTNLGPGFDCLGTSLQLWNRIKIEPDHNPGPVPEITGKIAELFFTHTGETRFPFSFSIDGEFSQARGLGSSVTLRLGVLLALDRITKSGLSKEEICNLCAQLEGHPASNAAAALYRRIHDRFKEDQEEARCASMSIRVSGWCLFIPNFLKRNGPRKIGGPNLFLTT